MHMPTYRVTSILNALSNSQEGYTLSELTRKTGILTGTISPILKTLLEEGFLEMAPTGNRYKIGMQAYYIGLAFSKGSTTLELVRKEMEKLSKECNETCQMGILREGEVFYLLKVEGNESIRVVSEVGGSLPAYATGLGKAILSKYEESELKTFYPEGLKALTANTVTDMEELNRQIEAIKSSGFSYEEGESGEHTACIGTAICQNGEIVAGLSVVFPIFRKSEEKAQTIRQALIKCKTNIEKILVNNSLI